MYSTYYLFLFSIIVGFTYFVLQFRVNSINPISSRLTLSVKQLQPVMEELKKARAVRKGILTKSCNKTDRIIGERSLTAITDHREHLIKTFQLFEDSAEEYCKLLTSDSEIETADDYYNGEMKLYVEQLGKLNSAMDTLHIKQQPVREDVSTIAAMSHVLNMPKLELESFDGTPAQYHKFMSIFTQVIEPVTPDPTLRLTRLLCHTTGEAHQAISGVDLGDAECYTRAMAILKENFGSKYVVGASIMRNLKHGPIATTPKDIRNLATELQNAETCLKRHNMYGELNNQECIVAVCGRLTKDMKSKWASKTIKHQRLASEYLSFSDFVTFIANEASRLNDPIFGALQESSTTRAGSHQKPASFATSTDQSATKDKKSTWSASRRSSCLVCGDSHILFFCKTFRSMSPDERMKVVTEHKLCINCLLSNHTVKDCNKSYVCTVNDCKQKHCKLLHSSIVKSVQGINTIVNLDINVASSHIMMPIVPIIVNNSYATYALLDTGSSHSFCSKRLVSALGIQGNPTAYDLMTLNNAEKKNTLEVDISLQPEDRSDSFELQRVLVTESIPVRTEDVDLTKYNHLNNMSYPATDSVDVLIGQNYSDLLFIHEYRKGGPGEPYAARTSLGWCFHGPTVSAASHAMVTSTFISSKVIEQKLDRLYEFDQDGLIDSSTCDWSVEDTDVIELWHKSSKIEDQHISLPIPWKYANLKMPNNFYLAKHRLESLVKSIKKKDMMAQYSHEVQQLINNGYAELAPIDHETPTRCWYVPHHSVPKKSGQLRLVFDCSAQYKGTSINNSTSQGPKLTCDLFDILIRFRQFKHAVMGDIRHMYNQVRIPTSDRDALRFLWYIDGNLVHYRMTCFTFGGIFCASGSSYALQETAKLAPSQHVKDVILQNVYVDDMAYSSSDVQEAKDTISKVKEVLAQRSFCLTKFVATDQEMLTDVDPQDQLPIKVRQIQCQSDKALGLGWDVKADKLYIIHKLQHASTRSELLSSLPSIFDPLGLMAPLTIHGKLIFQETTRMKLPWKSALPPDIQNEWNTWTDMLGHLNRIQVSRCLIPPEFTDGAFELHVFGDASNQAYGSVAFLRCLNRFGNIHVVMLCSKNRVNPLKSTATIPRLELQAAVLCTSLESSISKALSIQLLPTSFWTDSMIVLCKDCITCKKLFAPSGVQKMADLPEERLQYDKLPFDHVSVDCFGPYSVKYRRTTCKRYGCVFTCHNTRAIHIEKLEDLSCESFINGMRRFISRRGKPSLIKSDRGTNFTAAESELRKSMQKFDIDWQFLPAGASHMNRVVERQIRTIRKVFTGLLTDEQRLTDDILATLFCEVEGIVNSRPLTKVSDDPSDDAAMTPSDLLIVRSSQPVALGKFCQGDMLRRRWRYTQHLVEMFWKRYLREYIPQLQKRMKWTRERKTVKEGDLVLVIDENSPRKQWPMALIVETREGRDGLVRSVKLRSKDTCITRSVTKIVPLECD